MAANPSCAHQNEVETVQFRTVEQLSGVVVFSVGPDGRPFLFAGHRNLDLEEFDGGRQDFRVPVIGPFPDTSDSPVLPVRVNIRRIDLLGGPVVLEHPV